MCMTKGLLEWFHSSQPFLPNFKVEWRCDICTTEFNCGQMLNCFPPYIMSRSRSRSPASHMNSEVLPASAYEIIYVTDEIIS